RLGDDGIERLQPRVRLARRRHNHLQHLIELGDLVLAVDDALPRQGLVEHDARRVDVSARGDLLAARLLWGHVADLALDLAVTRRLYPPGTLGDAEVEHSGDPVRADHDV